MSFIPIQIRSLTITMLDLITEIFSRYCLIVLLLLGITGLILNTLIFTRKIFRQNSCVHYFLASTVANYFVVFFILPSRVLSDGYYIDPGQYNLFYCKLRFYVYFTAKSLSSWFIVLACFDRKMSSSQRCSSTRICSSDCFTLDDLCHHRHWSTVLCSCAYIL